MKNKFRKLVNVLTNQLSPSSKRIEKYIENNYRKYLDETETKSKWLEDEKAIRSDFETVGEDIRTVMGISNKKE